MSGRTYDSKKANAVIEEALARARVILDRQEARTRIAMKHETDEAAVLLDLQGRSGGDGCTAAIPTNDSSRSEEQQAVDAHLQLKVEKSVEFSYIIPTDQDDGGREINLPTRQAMDVPAPKSQKSEKQKKPKPLWREYTDHSSGQTYYFNRETKETTWDRPGDHELLKIFPY